MGGAAKAYGVLLVCGLVLGAGDFVYPYLVFRDHLLAWHAAAGLVAALCVLRAARAPVGTVCSIWPVLGCAVLAAFAVQLGAQAWWPNSGDEYGYLFLADTLLHGRLWNPPPPVPKLFDFAWIFVRDGKWFSQYPPAWPVMMAPFRAFGCAWLTNPLLTGLLGWLTWRALTLLRVGAETAVALTALLLLCPFTLFNGASYFPHMFTADLVMGIIVLHLRDEALPAMRHRFAMGGLFGILVLTRYEGFVLTAACLGLEIVWRRRQRFFAELWPVALGALPGLVAMMGYDTAITGAPFRTPFTWMSSGAKFGLPVRQLGFFHALGHAVAQTAYWTGELAGYGGLLLLALMLLALLSMLRWSDTLRWFDLLLPATILFFFFYPFDGGHEYGPRYWFFAWPAGFLTLGTASGRWHRHMPALARAHLPLFAGAAMSLAAFNTAYVTQRRLVLVGKPPSMPAIILVPSRNIVASPVQAGPIFARSDDFTRNGVSLDGPVLYGRADKHFENQSEYQALACSLKGRTVYRRTAEATFDLVPCRWK